MRGIILATLAILVLTAHPQPLVVAGCENEQHLKKAEQLIEQTRKENWDRTKWETECRKAGFEVVGDERVVYLIPLYYTPAFVDRLFSLSSELLKRSAPIARLDELEPALQEALLALSYRPSIPLQVIKEPSSVRMRTRLLNGEVLIGVLDLWDFKERESGETLPLLQSRQTYVTPRAISERFSANSLPSEPTPSPRPKLSEVSLKRWHFLFSTSLSVQAQVEHMQAYLQWLQTLQTQVAQRLPNATEQLWERLYPEQTRPPIGALYTEEDLLELTRQRNLEFIMRPNMVSQFARKDWIFTQWTVGLQFVSRPANGRGVISTFIPLEVLLGLREY